MSKVAYVRKSLYKHVLTWLKNVENGIYPINNSGRLLPKKLAYQQRLTFDMFQNKNRKNMKHIYIPYLEFFIVTDELNYSLYRSNITMYYQSLLEQFSGKSERTSL